MSEISYTLRPEEIEWEMDWKGIDPGWQRKYPGKPEKELFFEDGKAVAHLLINDVIFLNSHHWEKEWPEKARQATALLVYCSDIFAWACSDAEEISVEHGEIETLYSMWKADPVWGSALWCMVKRKEMPQAPVAKAMRESGIDLAAFQEKHGLRVNFGNGMCFALKQAGVKWDDKDGVSQVRAQFIKDNGWEGDDNA